MFSECSDVTRDGAKSAKMAKMAVFGVLEVSRPLEGQFGCSFVVVDVFRDD